MGEVSAQQALVHPGVLPVGCCRDRFDPLLTLHTLRVVASAPVVPQALAQLGRAVQDDDVTTRDPLRPLFDAALEGDDRAVRELVTRTQPAVWRVCSVLGSPGEEDDLVQETYLRALRSATSFRGDAPVQAWLLSVARNVCADHVRRRQRQRRLVERISRNTLADSTPVAESVDQLLLSLLPEQREAFELTQLVGLSYEEAAAVAGCPVGTIRSRVARARAHLLEEVRRTEAV